MFKASWCLGNEDFGGIAALRNALGVPVDALDEYAAHVYVADENNKPIAAGRMYPVDDTLRIDKILSVPECETALYEELVLRILLYRARELPQKTIAVESTPDIEEVLPKFGFSPIEGQSGLMQCARESIAWFSQCGD